MQTTRRLLVALTVFLVACAQETPPPTEERTEQPPEPPTQTADSRPNLILLVADDMAYTDIGAFGGEINTPNLDALAERSIKFTNFHVVPTCAPTRSILLSGTDHHTAGVGTMFGANYFPMFEGREGYEMYLTDRVATLPELLSDAGYHTYLAGKWHLGVAEGQWPIDRGFERSFALLPGSGDHFDANPQQYVENDRRLRTPPENFYSTRTHTDKLIEFVDEHDGDNQPFFIFAAYTSPHWPLQAPEDFIDRYAGDYDEGWDALRANRVASATSLGVVPEVPPEDFERVGPAWSELGEDAKKHYARRMEIYAAMVENLDHNIGRLLDHLESIGELDDTVIFFMSDNGAESDEMEMNPTFVARFIEGLNADNSLENIGHRGSWASYGPGWAQAGAAPFNRFKGYVTEGGTRVPAFVLHAGESTSGRLDDQYLSAIDIAPTMLELAGAEHPGSPYRGREVAPIVGRSFASLLDGDTTPVYEADHAFAIELHGGRSVRRGQYKLVWEQPAGNSYWGYPIPDDWYRWQLYDLEADPGETTDLSDQHPELREELVAVWDDYAESHDVVRDARIFEIERWQTGATR